jgi:ligand-binding sensor domain-containing protein
MRVYCIKLTVAFILISLISHAQSYTIIQYSVPEGLPSSEVYEIYEDHEGFIWFATDNGVTRFDGAGFENFYDHNQKKL